MQFFFSPIAISWSVFVYYVIIEESRYEKNICIVVLESIILLIQRSKSHTNRWAYWIVVYLVYAIKQVKLISIQTQLVDKLKTK